MMEPLKTMRDVQRRDRHGAALLAFVFGWAGAHWFYLRRPARGALYLLLFWTTIPFILSVFECIWIELMSDERFDASYNADNPR